MIHYKNKTRAFESKFRNYAHKNCLQLSKVNSKKNSQTKFQHKSNQLLVVDCMVRFLKQSSVGGCQLLAGGDSYLSIYKRNKIINTINPNNQIKGLS